MAVYSVGWTKLLLRSLSDLKPGSDNHQNCQEVWFRCSLGAEVCAPCARAMVRTTSHHTLVTARAVPVDKTPPTQTDHKRDDTTLFDQQSVSSSCSEACSLACVSVSMGALLEHANFLGRSFPVPADNPTVWLKMMCQYLLTQRDTERTAYAPNIKRCTVELWCPDRCEAHASGPPSASQAQTGDDSLCGCRQYRMERSHDDLTRGAREHNRWGSVDVIFESKSAGLYRLNIASGKAIPLHVHKVMDESELVLDAGLLCQGRPAWPGLAHRWLQAKHCYSNPGDGRTRSVLCVDSPCFRPDDEIVVDGTPDEVPYLPTTMDVWGPSPHLTFKFPGAFALQGGHSNGDDPRYHGCLFSPDQQVTLITDPSRFVPSDAVLVLAFDRRERLLLVRHRRRGWELPGGKVEPGESDNGASLRETREEAGINLEESSLRPVAQYCLQLRKPNATALQKHTKTVLFGRFGLTPATSPSTFTNETSDRRLLNVWTADGGLDPSLFPFSDTTQHGLSGVAPVSTLLRDNVLPLGLRLARALLDADVSAPLTLQ